MLTISKTTHNMAKIRGIELTLSEGIGRDDETLVCFWESEEESEWMFSYQVAGHQLEWHGNIYASDSIVAALPPVITNDTALRDVVRKLAILMAEEKKSESPECL